MKILDIAFNNFKQLSRDRKNLFFILIFPLIFMLIFGFVFGGDSFNSSTLTIGVIDNDDTTLSHDFINVLEDAEYDNSDKMFDIITVSNEREGDNLIENDTIEGLIIIPEGFNDDIVSSLSGSGSSNIIVKGNPTSQGYGLFLGLINGVLDGFSSEILTSMGKSTSNLIVLESKNLNGTTAFNQFDYVAPGLIVFAILMSITTMSSSIAKETENGMLTRLKLSKMKSKDYILGNLLSWLLISVIQVIIMLLVAILINYHWQGGYLSILYAIIIGLVTTISSVAISLIIVSFTKSSEQATNLAAIIAVPLSFLAGSFFTVEGFKLSIFNFTFDILEISPFYQATKAFTSVLNFGNSFVGVLPKVVYIFIIGLILLAIAIMTFKHKLNKI